jgi:hypothetical protein
MLSLNCSSKSSMTSNFPSYNIFLCEYWSPLLLYNLPLSLQVGVGGKVKYSSYSSLCGAKTNKFNLSTRGVLILQICELYDMLHFLFFNCCTYIHTWMSIFINLILKYRSSDKNKLNILYAILHCLIHILRVFFGFCCFILFILSL